jgi:hypothetical protein
MKRSLGITISSALVLIGVYFLFNGSQGGGFNHGFAIALIGSITLLFVAIFFPMVVR